MTKLRNWRLERMRVQIYKPKICEICSENYIPTSPTQKVCIKSICKKKHNYEHRKEYNQKPEVRAKRKGYKLKYCIKKGMNIVEHSKFEYSSEGVKIGFKSEWFYKKFPKDNYENDIYQEKGWIMKTLEIRLKFKDKCQKCGRFALEVHHIKPYYYNPQIALLDSNLMLLCKRCHTKEHNKGKRD